jgi:hypothetical protein
VAIYYLRVSRTETFHRDALLIIYLVYVAHFCLAAFNVSFRGLGLIHEMFLPLASCLIYFYSSQYFILQEGVEQPQLEGRGGREE